MTHVVERAAIEAALPGVDMIAMAEQAFIAQSQGAAVVPPVGELLFDDPPGDVHIKYGYLQGGSHYVVKIASGFYQNPSLGLPANNGVVMVFSMRTGALEAVLLDEGILTDHRTAAAGACAAKLLAPKNINAIGIIGTGVQAALQLRYLAGVTDCREVLVWGRSASSVDRFRNDLADTDFNIAVSVSPEVLSQTCELIVTATASTEALLSAIPAGRHVTAVGADTPMKRELAAELLASADVLAVDSLPQSGQRGEVYRARGSDYPELSSVVELGDILLARATGRVDDSQRTIADLTGVASQDLLVATAILDIISSAGPA